MFGMNGQDHKKKHSKELKLYAISLVLKKVIRFPLALYWL